MLNAMTRPGTANPTITAEFTEVDKRLRYRAESIAAGKTAMTVRTPARAPSHAVVHVGVDEITQLGAQSCGRIVAIGNAAPRPLHERSDRHRQREEEDARYTQERDGPPSAQRNRPTGALDVCRRNDGSAPGALLDEHDDQREHQQGRCRTEGLCPVDQAGRVDDACQGVVSEQLHGAELAQCVEEDQERAAEHRAPNQGEHDPAEHLPCAVTEQAGRLLRRARDHRQPSRDRQVHVRVGEQRQHEP